MIKQYCIRLTLVFIVVICYLMMTDKQPFMPVIECAESIAVNNLRHMIVTKKHNIEIDLYLMRQDIYKRQISNLQAEIDGLKTIINKDPKLKHLIKVKK